MSRISVTITFEGPTFGDDDFIIMQASQHLDSVRNDSWKSKLLESVVIKSDDGYYSDYVNSHYYEDGLYV